MALSTSLVAYWKLDETSGNRADSVGSNTLVDNNTVLYDTGKVGNAANFEIDTAEYLNIADNADLSTGDIDFSWSLWVNLESKPEASMHILDKYVSLSDGAYFLQWQQATDRFRAITTDGGGANYAYVVANNLGAPALATWYHIVYWHDATANEVGIVVNDGTPDTASYSDGCNDDDNEFRIGARNADTDYNFDGMVDEVGFWKKVLSAAEITRLYNGGDGLTYPFPNEILAGAITPAGAVAKKPGKPVVGAITPAGAVAKKTKLPSLAGTITFAGGFIAKAKKALAGAITFVGTLAQYKLWILFARFHDYFLNAPQRFTISSNKVQMTARYRDYSFTAPEKK